MNATNATYVYVNGVLTFCGHPHIDRGYCVLCLTRLSHPEADR